LYELDVDMEVGPLFLNNPFPSSDLPDPDLELLSKFSPFLVLLLFPHMILRHSNLFVSANLYIFFYRLFGPHERKLILMYSP